MARATKYKMTYIIGNGFDICQGCKTRYSDFYKRYTEKGTETSDYPLKFRMRPYDGEENDLDEDAIKIYERLRERLVEYGDAAEAKGNRHKAAKDGKLRKIENWADFEQAIGEFSSEIDYTEDNADIYIEILTDFAEKFGLYIADEVEKKSADRIRDGEKIYHMMEKSIETIVSLIGIPTDAALECAFVSFNYTRLLNDCVASWKEKGKTNRFDEVVDSALFNVSGVGSAEYIHGNLSKNMIIGVDNQAQITNEDFRKNEEELDAFIKSRQRSDRKIPYELKMRKIIEKSNAICIFGTSIGETDKRWWSEIALWLTENKNNRLVICRYDKRYNYKKANKHPQAAQSLQRAEQEVKNKFLSYAELNAEIRNSIESQIIVTTNPAGVFEKIEKTVR